MISSPISGPYWHAQHVRTNKMICRGASTKSKVLISNGQPLSKNECNQLINCPRLHTHRTTFTKKHIYSYFCVCTCMDIHVRKWSLYYVTHSIIKYSNDQWLQTWDILGNSAHEACQNLGQPWKWPIILPSPAIPTENLT